MDVITTHVNADFDCLGAMIAARKLYPHALLVFSGAQEKSMRDFFLKSTGYALNFTRLKDLDLAGISRLILVDCQHSSRIGRFAEILQKPGLQIHIYDHHPEAFGDIKASGGEIRACGASTTILCKILMQQGAVVSASEATLMMLGIYEDTGKLTFPSTTADDYLAAAWLLGKGANLNTVADFLIQELTAEQVSLLNDLLKSLTIINLNGMEVAIAQTSVDYYIGDIAILAHMMRDMENLNALFLAVEMGKRVYLVARSRLPEVDAGEIMREFGGGGHATAASATVKELTLIQVVEKLKDTLRNLVTPKRLASEIMSAPVKTLPAELSIAGAQELLVRYNVNAMPVMDKGRMVGIISRRIVEKAIYHDLGNLPVSEYMYTEFLAATADTPLVEIQEYLVGHNRRFVPIFAGNELTGVVTRTDLLRYMQAGLHGKKEALYDLGRDHIRARKRDVVHLLGKHLSPRLTQILQDLGQIGDELDLPVYAVGGFVRDLLLGGENFDLDVTVEGDGILFAETFARRYQCRVKSHQKFGTAVIVFPDGIKIDVASTRLEYYASPGALPTVERSSLKADLYRRDFTINTLAVRLNRGDYGQLIDFFGAQRDLQEKTIRVLHNLSFVEDPSRVFRAIRFEQRLGFSIAKHTENLIKNAVRLEFLERLGGKRLLTELVLIFREKEPLLAVERMAAFGLLKYIHPDLQLTPDNRLVLEEARKIISWFELLFLERQYEKWVVYFLALCEPLADEEFWGTCTRLSVSEHYKEKLFDGRKSGAGVLAAMQRRLSRPAKVLNSEIYGWLKELPVEVLLYLMAKTGSGEVKKAISLFFTQLQNVRPLINGDDLKRLGVPAGPRFRELLDKVLNAKLNRPAMSREDELAIVKRELGRM